MAKKQPTTPREALKAYNLILASLAKYRGREEEPSPLEIARAAALVVALCIEKEQKLEEVVPDPIKRAALQTWADSFDELHRIHEQSKS